VALGYEDLNDLGALHTDTLLQTAVGRAEELASAPTLCRLEGRADRAMRDTFLAAARALAP
jgi:hypothetical protein